MIVKLQSSIFAKVSFRLYSTAHSAHGAQTGEGLNYIRWCCWRCARWWSGCAHVGPRSGEWDKMTGTCSPGWCPAADQMILKTWRAYFMLSVWPAPEHGLAVSLIARIESIPIIFTMAICSSSTTSHYPHLIHSDSSRGRLITMIISEGTFNCFLSTLSGVAKTPSEDCQLSQIYSSDGRDHCHCQCPEFSIISIRASYMKPLWGILEINMRQLWSKFS